MEQRTPPPRPPGPVSDDDRSTEDPGNFKRTPPVKATERDPLDSGRRLNSNQVLLISMAVGVLLAVPLAVLFVL